MNSSDGELLCMRELVNVVFLTRRDVVDLLWRFRLRMTVDLVSLRFRAVDNPGSDGWLLRIRGTRDGVLERRTLFIGIGDDGVLLV